MKVEFDYMQMSMSKTDKIGTINMIVQRAPYGGIDILCTDLKDGHSAGFSLTLDELRKLVTWYVMPKAGFEYAKSVTDLIAARRNDVPDTKSKEAESKT